MRRTFAWIELALAALVAVGVMAQVYFIAAYVFGADDALDVHEALGGIVHLVEVLVFIAALVAFWRVNWGLVGHAFALAAIGTVQLAFSEGEDWVGGLHGLFATFVFLIALAIVSINLRHLRRDPAWPAARPAT